MPLEDAPVQPASGRHGASGRARPVDGRERIKREIALFQRVAQHDLVNFGRLRRRCSFSPIRNSYPVQVGKRQVFLRNQAAQF